jgi:hypothetical protein
VLASSGAAQAKTYRVSRQQVIDDAAAGRAHMTGGLVGRWTITSFKETAKTPLIRARGRERFTGCIDRARDGSCAGDPTGTLRFRFQYWAQPGAMVDTPTTEGNTRTDYVGNLTLGEVGPASARMAAVGCGGSGTAG